VLGYFIIGIPAAYLVNHFWHLKALGVWVGRAIGGGTICIIYAVKIL